MKVFAFLGLLCLAGGVAADVDPNLEVNTCFDKDKILKEAAKSEDCQSLQVGKPDDHESNFINDCFNKRFGYENTDGSIDVQNMIKAIQASTFNHKTEALVNAINNCNTNGATVIPPLELNKFMTCFTNAQAQFCLYYYQ